jgi:hypothetical protein
MVTRRIPTSYLIGRPLLTGSHINQVEESQTAAEAREEVSQLTRIFYLAVSNECRRQALQVGKCSNDNVQPVRIVQNSGQVFSCLCQQLTGRLFATARCRRDKSVLKLGHFRIGATTAPRPTGDAYRISVGISID